MKKLLVVSIAFLWISIFGSILAEAGGPGGEEDWYEGWSVEKRPNNKATYLTHGRVVWGHEFGFYKNPTDCKGDILWLSFSARDEKVKDFSRKIVTVSLDIDGEIFKVQLEMFYAGIIGFTQVMHFSNWLAGEQLMNALEKGHYVTVKILEPKGLEALLDIKEDEFGLKGFADSRKAAELLCKGTNLAKYSYIK